nr:LAGLIDADG endonuclease [Taiwanofungus camphoratus]WRO45184.1 LAGLIDADG endonuclease [Taiwanofungus sp. YW-2023a]
MPALNLAVCWKPLSQSLYLLDLRQSAGNLVLPFDSVGEGGKQLGILRDSTPEFIFCNIAIFSSVPQMPVRSGVASAAHPFGSASDPRIEWASRPRHVREEGEKDLISQLPDVRYNSEFSAYLAGLIEGEGTIIVPKSIRSDKGKLYYPSIQIVFHLKDLPLAMLIQKELGHGSLSRKKGVNAYVLTINNFDGLILITRLINGNMKTPKIHALFKLIDWLNCRYETINLEKLPLNSTILSENAWLSGFIEADGHFSLRTTSDTKYPRVECKLEISQRQKDHNGYNNLVFLSSIAEFLLTEVKPIRINRVKPEYRLRTTSLKGNLIIENYLKKYPLFGSKYLDSIDWLKALNLFKQGLNKENNKISKDILEIKSVMNNKRQQFVWDHLQKFYKLDK